ncbi:Zn-dependent hydrolase [Georgenia sp. AZ-5]|uniref:Zn-dependent hydrolase n=1 Tax=Georgenia sp. AZ-5 TaxID=3367526 RepID=UPI0037547690
MTTLKKSPAAVLLPSAARIAADIAHFASLSEPGSGVTRLAYSTLERQAHAYFRAAMEELGLSVRTDAAGNTIAEAAGTDPGARALGTGSHLDSVPSGGRFDGIAGVAAAMEVARLLSTTGLRTCHPVRIVVFASEEGARFGQACNGSRIVAGLTDTADLERLTDADGITMAAAMRSVGLHPHDIGDARWHHDDWAAFIELHIEQGSVLESLGVPVGVVDVISGSTRLAIDLHGRASHSGGTPMHQRADALAAASELVLLAERLARRTRHHGTRATVGRLEVSPGSLTTIPGKVRFTLDVRDVDADRQHQTVSEFLSRATELCQRRTIRLTSQLLADTPPVVLPERVKHHLVRASEARGVAYRVMPSGASHDAQMVNRVVPTGMVFVPSRDGISHAPEEWTNAEDIATGAGVLLEALLALDAEPDRRTA